MTNLERAFLAYAQRLKEEAAVAAAIARQHRIGLVVIEDGRVRLTDAGERAITPTPPER